MVYAAQNRIEASVVIRASGGRGRLQTQGFPNTEDTTRKESALLVDLKGRFDQWADSFAAAGSSSIVSRAGPSKRPRSC
jgi:hypothetical protein